MCSIVHLLNKHILKLNKNNDMDEIYSSMDMYILITCGEKSLIKIDSTVKLFYHTNYVHMFGHIYFCHTVYIINRLNCN